MAIKNNISKLDEKSEKIKNMCLSSSYVGKSVSEHFLDNPVVMHVLFFILIMLFSTFFFNFGLEYNLFDFTSFRSFVLSLSQDEIVHLFAIYNLYLVFSTIAVIGHFLLLKRGR